MARSESFNKKDKEKKRLERRQNKAEKMQERKANKRDGHADDMIAYVDENGNLSSTPPDPRKMKQINAEDISISVPKYVEEPEEAVKTGTVTFFNDAKGFGFIKDSRTGESVFVHINQLVDRIKENDKVSFETQRGPKGWNAVGVKKI